MEGKFLLNEGLGSGRSLISFSLLNPAIGSPPQLSSSLCTHQCRALTADPDSHRSTGGLTYMVADPDPDGSDPFQITVGLLEQVTHQFIQATLDSYLGNRKAMLHQSLGEFGARPFV